MISLKTRLTLIAALTPLLGAGCVSQLEKSPTMTDALQMISAGHTGCLPRDNRIADISMQLNGSGTWSATCNDKTYLCSAFKGVNPSVSYSCALEVDKSHPDPQ